MAQRRRSNRCERQRQRPICVRERNSWDVALRRPKCKWDLGREECDTRYALQPSPFTDQLHNLIMYYTP
eukprot:3401845-Prymnesium_polylepis.1